MGTIKNDGEDRTSKRETLEKYVNPLNPNHTGLVNNYTRFLTEIKINVYDSVDIGKQHQCVFEESWTKAFYATTKIR